MFWTILYIIGVRYSSEPYQLSPNSRARLLFQNHGGRVARHPIATILLLTILFVTLCYPVPFLYAKPTSDNTSTHHVWNIARPSTSFQKPDIGCKQAWIQGSYMGALEGSVLEEAFIVQQALLGDDVSCDPLTTSNHTQSPNDKWGDMFLHTPLLYWNCSLSNVRNDKDIIQTVNKNYLSQSPVNITLRWGTVLAGKQFHHDRLVGADALVISFWYKLNTNAGDLWDERVSRLAADSASKERWDIHPSDGLVTNKSVYEVLFQPMSMFDVFGICLCYGAIFWYLYHCLRDMHAIRSRFGLFVTVVLQVAASVTASFTILAIFKIPISHIPMEFYPVVIMVVGLENMSRLTNAVFKVSPQVSVHQRMALAVGEVGVSSTIAVAFDLFLLFLFSHISFAAVREYCAFAGVAITLDFILHLTFFIAVLSIDVNRLELQDTIDKMNNSNGPAKKSLSISENPSIYYNLKNFFSQRLSTRIAGTAIMMSFIVGLNYHFLENGSPLETLKFLLKLTLGKRNLPRRMSNVSAAGPMNQARTPAAWIRLQDQLTAKELIRVAKPGASRLVTQAYDPVYFVHKGASRVKPQLNTTSIFSSLDINVDAIGEHLQAFLYTIIVVSAIVTIILNYLLRHDLPDDGDSISDKEVEFITSHTLRGSHTLDVVHMVSSRKGMMISAGLDHRLAIWNLGPKSSYRTELIRFLPEQNLWPILVVAVDDRGDWIAIASKSGLVSFWNVKQRCFVRSLMIELNQRRPLAFFFSTKYEHDSNPRLTIAKHEGLLCDILVTGGGIIQHWICPHDRAIQSKQVRSTFSPYNVVTGCESGKIYITGKQDGVWRSHKLEVDETPLSPPIVSQYALQSLHSLGLVLRVQSCTISLIELRTGSILHSFQCGYFKPNGFQAFHGRRKTCIYCGGPSISFFSVAYKEGDSGTLIMHTFSTASSASRSMCLLSESKMSGKCRGFHNVTEKMHWIENVETWEAVNNLVLGIRRRQHTTSSQKVEPATVQRRQKFSKTVDEDDGEWEAWTMTSDGEVNTYPLHDRDRHLSRLNTTSLLVSRTGPAIKLGTRSVAIGFGNSIKVLVAGVERYEDSEDEDENTSYLTTFQRKRAHRKAK